MNAQQRSNPSARYPLKMILRLVLLGAFGAAVYSVVSSQPGNSRVDTTSAVGTAPAETTVQPASWMPAPSSTASEGNVVDLTYPPY